MKMKNLLAPSLLVATVAVAIHFSTRSRQSEVEPTKASKSNEAGWTIGLYQVDNGELKQFGDGVARTNEATGQVLALDIVSNIGDSQSRMVVNDEGTFIGAMGLDRDIWIDVTDPAVHLPFEQAVGLASAVKRGSKPVRSVSSGGRRLDVFETPGDAVVTTSTSVLSRDETWVDAAGAIRRMVRFTYVVSKGVERQTVITIADRDDSISTVPAAVRPGDAIPAAAVIRRLAYLRSGARTARPPVDESFGVENDEIRLGNGLLHPVQFAPPQGPARTKKFPFDPIENLPGVYFCEGEFREGEWTFPCLESLPPDHPVIALPAIGAGTRQPSTDSRGSQPDDRLVCRDLTDLLVKGGAGLGTIGVGEVLIRVATALLPGYGYAYLAGYAAGVIAAIGFDRVLACSATLIITSVLHGDPHLTTFDGYSYGLQARGEFVYLDTPGFEVQVRFEGSKGLATRTVAAAARAGSHVIESYFAPGSQRPDRFSVVIDGSARVLDFDGTSFPDGTFVARRHGSRNSDDNVLIVDPTGSYVLIENHIISQNVLIGVARDTKIRGGLIGVPDGDTSNDFTLRDGTVISLPAVQTVDGLYGRFAQSWRVRPKERLFTQGAALDFLTDEYTSLPPSMTRLSNFSQAEIEKARGECRKRGVAQGVSLDDCTYDVVATGNVEWADQAAGSAAVWSLTGNIPSVVRNEVKIEAPQSVVAGSAIQIVWKGPNAPDDLIFVAAPDMAPNQYQLSNFHNTAQGSPAQLVAPAQAGRYEIRYFSHAKGAVLARFPLAVTDAEVRLDSPGRVAAGSTVEFAWKGPNAPDDLIFIATPDMATNQFPGSNRHATQQGSPAKLVAPAQAGRYEIRYFSYTNGAVLTRFPLAVTDAEVRLDSPGRVAAGSTIEFAWKGPNAPDDFIFIATPSMASNEYVSGPASHATQQGSPAKLVAPAQAGRYEIRYFSYTNGAVLKKQGLIVH